MTTSNDITVVGNLTRDPELRYTQGGQARVAFGIACNRRYQQNGEWKENTSFFNAVAWAILGENVAHSLKKGDRVVISGRLEQRTYEVTPEGGGAPESRSIVEIVADEVGPSLRWATVAVTKNDRTPASVPNTGAEEDPFKDFQ